MGANIEVVSILVYDRLGVISNQACAWKLARGLLKDVLHGGDVEVENVD